MIVPLLPQLIDLLNFCVSSVADVGFVAAADDDDDDDDDGRSAAHLVAHLVVVAAALADATVDTDAGVGVEHHVEVRSASPDDDVLLFAPDVEQSAADGALTFPIVA